MKLVMLVNFNIIFC